MADALRVVSLVPSVTETLLAWGVVPVACTRFCEQPDLAHVGGTKDPDVPAIVGLDPDLVIVDREENRRDRLRRGGSPAKRRARALDRRGGLSSAPLGHGDRWVVAPTRGRRNLAAHADPIETVGWIDIREGAAAQAAEELKLSIPHTGTDLGKALSEIRPDFVVAPSEPYPFTQRHVDELRTVAADVRLVDGRDVFWWGVRTPGARRRLTQSVVRA